MTIIQSFRFEVRIPKPSGGEYVMPFGNDPPTGMNRIDTHSRLAAFDGDSRLALPGQDEAYAEFARQGFPPEMYKLAMERAGIDYMVVYPSTGLLTTAVPDLPAHTAAAYRRAYNNWLHDFCAAAGGRVLGAAAVDLRDAEEAAREARRCVKEFDFKAVYINPVPVGEHRLYDDFYERCGTRLKISTCRWPCTQEPATQQIRCSTTTCRVYARHRRRWRLRWATCWPARL